MHAKKKKPSDNYSVAPTATRSSVYWEKGGHESEKITHI